MSQYGKLLRNRLEPSKGEEWQESDLWAGPQTAIHTHSKPPCVCVFHMPSRSPHITVCTTMIHSQPTCDCAWQCGKLWLALLLTFNIYLQSPLLPSAAQTLKQSPGKSKEGWAQCQQDAFFQSQARMRISPIQSWTSRRDKNFWHSISCFKTRLRKISFNLRQRDEVKIHCFRSETLRRERQDKTIIARILVNLICCLQLDWYFPKKKGLFIS